MASNCPRSPVFLMNFAAFNARAGAPNTFLRSCCSLVLSPPYVSCHNSQWRGQEKRTWRTVCEPLLHSHLSSSTSSTFLRNRNCRKPIFAVRNCTISKLNSLGTDLCSRRTFIVGSGHILYSFRPVFSFVYPCFHSASRSELWTALIAATSE